MRLTNSLRTTDFDCKGSDKTSRCGCTQTLLSDKLVHKLQALIKLSGSSITITSGYRCDKHNRYVGGASSSYHTKGMAADLRVKGMNPKDAARLAQTLGFTGIGMYNGIAGVFIHCDVRPKAYFWKNTSGKNLTVKTHGGEHKRCPYRLDSANKRKGSKGSGVKATQWILNTYGYPLSVDGVFGSKTESAVKTFQKDMGLAADGIVGAKTRAALSDVAE